MGLSPANTVVGLQIELDMAQEQDEEIKYIVIGAIFYILIIPHFQTRNATIRHSAKSAKFRQ